MAYSHVHIGAGLFGLGMVLDLCQQAGLESVVLNRHSDDPHHRALRSHRRYRIVYDDDPSKSKIIELKIHYYHDAADVHAAEIIAAPSVELLTTSVTPDGLRAVAPLIAQAVEKRQSTKAPPLCIMACENLSMNSQKLIEYIGPHLSRAAKDYFLTHICFSNTVVDRVCADIADAPDCVEVAAESFSEWIIEVPQRPFETVNKLSLVPSVRVIGRRAEVKGYEVRKYWCLNGTHLAAAAYAYELDGTIVLLSEALTNPAIREKVEAVQDELGFAFRCYAEGLGVGDRFTEENVKQFNDQVLSRFTKNRKERIIRLLKHEEQIEATIRDFVRAVLQPEIEQVIASIQMTIREGREWETRLRQELGGKLKGIMHEKLEKNLRLLDLHSFLERVTERIVGPQKEIVSHYQRRGESCPRLDLDDALQAITMATHKYAGTAYERATRTIREAIEA